MTPSTAWRRGELKSHPSVENPLSVCADLVVHGVRSQVDLSRPLDRAEMNNRPREERRIAQRFEYRSHDVGSTEPWPQIDRSPRAVDKLHVENAVIDDSDIADAPSGTRLDRQLYASKSYDGTGGWWSRRLTR